MKNKLGLIFIVCSVFAYSCPDFSGKWSGKCQSIDFSNGRTDSYMSFTLHQDGCSSVTFGEVGQGAPVKWKIGIVLNQKYSDQHSALYSWTWEKDFSFLKFAIADISILSSGTAQVGLNQEEYTMENGKLRLVRHTHDDKVTTECLLSRE